MGPRAWSLWTAQGPFRAFVLVVDIAAVTVVVATATAVPVDGRHLLWLAVLAGGSILHLEATRRIERLRELHAEGTLFVNLKSIWTFAGLLLLPPPLVVVLIAVTYTHMWFRVSRKIVPHRWVFSACNVVLASAAAGVVLVAADPSGYPDLPHGLSGLCAIAVAALVRWLVNTLLTGIALLLMEPGMTIVRAFGLSADDLIEFGSLGLGAAVAVTLFHDPAMVLVLAVPMLVVHRGLLLHQFESAAHRDRATGLHNAAFWYEMAVKQLERARRQHTTVGLLLIQVDGFEATADRHGAEIATRLLRRVADTVKLQLRQDDDLVGRLSRDEFAVLLPAIAPRELTDVAERVQRAMRDVHIDVDGASEPAMVLVTVSIGGATYPQTADTLDRLMLAADNALFNAQSCGRAQTRFAKPGTRANSR